MRFRRRPERGFTLLESLVALAIFAIALAAALRASGASTLHADEMRTRLLADWVAQNHMALQVARHEFPAPGMQQGAATEAGRRMLWREKVSETPNPAFRRVEISVASADEPDHVLRKITGFLVLHPR